MNEFDVITNVVEIKQLNKQLAKQLSKTFRFKETREISYPSGHHTGEVYFEHKAGQNVRAWAPHTQSDKLLNFIICGEPGTSKWLEITVQLNFPAETYNRRMAGAFVKDANGDVFIAHRGKLTKGHAGLRKDEVFREFSSRLIEADDQSKYVTLILISSLDDPNFSDRLCEFANEAREVAIRLGEDSNAVPKKENAAAAKNTISATTAQKRKFLLRDYFDEYAGTGNKKGYGGGKRTVEHGDIVKALEVESSGVGVSQKSQAIDLAVIFPDRVNLYEVKTSARTTDVYTGVGQLLIHGECINQLLGIKVQRYLVLPDRPKKEHEPHILAKGDMRIITFEKINNIYKFSGLSQ